MGTALNIISASAACAGMAWAVRGRSSQVFGESVWRGPRDRRAVALTFDDGPSEGTPQLLDVLARYQASATFFQCGANVERLPAMARGRSRSRPRDWQSFGTGIRTCSCVRRLPSSGN